MLFPENVKLGRCMQLLSSLLEVVRATVSWPNPRPCGTLEPMGRTQIRADGAARHTLKDDIAAYRHDLVRRAISPMEARKSVAIVEQLWEKTEARRVEDLTLATVLDFLTARCADRKWSSKTHDNELQRLRDFGKFLVERGRAEENPFAKIRKVRREKTTYGGDHTGSRAFALDEELAIVRAAEAACDALRIAGQPCNNRDLCYRLFGLTGLRHLEMKKLPWSDVHIDAAPFRIVCSAKWTKSKRWAEIPLNAEAVQILKFQRQFTRGQERVWASVPALNTLNLDMKNAEVAKVDGRGRHAGFHSFRKGLNTKARMLKADPEVRRNLLRHTKLELTLGTYSDVMREDMEGVVAGLPRLGKPEDDGDDFSTNGPQRGKKPKNDLTKRGHLADSVAGQTRATLAQSGPRTGPWASPLTRVCPNSPSPSGPGSVRGPASWQADLDLPAVWGDRVWSIGGSNPPPSASIPRHAGRHKRPCHEDLDLVDALIAGLCAFRHRLEMRRPPDGGAHGDEHIRIPVHPAPRSRRPNGRKR